MLRSNVAAGNFPGSPSSVGGTSVSNYDSLRILVLGDSGVGKSSLVHILCHGTVLTNPTWTIGASVEVKFHFYKEGSSEEAKQKPVILELFDIGGSLQHKSSRHIFYHNFHGVMFVHDLTNKKSLKNLLKWKDELVNRNHEGVSNLSMDGLMRSYNDFRGERYLTVPVLMVGTKSDIVPSPARLDRVTSIGKELGACDTIKLNCLNPSTVQAGTSCAVTLSKFYDKVIENSSSGRSHSSSSQTASSKLSSTHSKLSSGNLTRIHIE